MPVSIETDIAKAGIVLIIFPSFEMADTIVIIPEEKEAIPITKEGPNTNANGVSSSFSGVVGPSILIFNGLISLQNLGER